MESQLAISELRAKIFEPGIEVVFLFTYFRRRRNRGSNLLICFLLVGEAAAKVKSEEEEMIAIFLKGLIEWEGMMVKIRSLFFAF